jgi:pyruvate formate lyase activating enzyme
MDITRREFLKKAGTWAVASGLFSTAGCTTKEVETPEPSWVEARYYRPVRDDIVQCTLCPTECVITSGRRSFCRVRHNIGGTLYTTVYGNPCAVHADPIEKKPLFHVLPGTGAFSIATAGCNFRCKNCQNWQISQFPPEETENTDLPPEMVVEYAKKTGCASIAYTYAEPVVFYEYMLETARIAKGEGVLNLLHTNGYINPEPLKELAPYADAANVDLKSFSPSFYDEICAGELTPVLDTLKLLKEEGVHTEITNLVIPSLSDDTDMFQEMYGWIYENLGAEVPIHISRFSPMYKLKHLSPTPVDTLFRAREVAMEEGLEYVYIGNVPGNEAEDTYCPECGRLLIERTGYYITQNQIREGSCTFCGHRIPGIWGGLGA